MRMCPTVREYERAGKIVHRDGFWRLANGDRIPGHPNGLKASVDELYTPTTATIAPANYFMTPDIQLSATPSLIATAPETSSEAFVIKATPELQTM